jgi:putative selenate reductase
VLAGGRIVELKTVQLNDRLVIPRPCIDATNVAFNVEWSQELRIPESLEEYAKARLLLAALERMGVLPANDTLFDLSVGYDLAGIQAPPMRAFVEGMKDASAIFARLLAELPDDLAAFRDLAPSPRLVDGVTLSTFHGCPADEIESIAQYLMEHDGLHVVVKLNPTLLGYDDVRAILNEQLGYRELVLRKASFDKDLQWPQAVAMIGRLRAVAQRVGLRFGVKLTNTMIVDNHKTFFKDQEMYLSGQPLHVLATQLLSRLRSSLKDDFPEMPVSFSAGIDKTNFPDAVALGMVPVTVCTDLLRTGGYTRLPAYLRELDARMHAVGAVDVDSFILKARAQGTRAVDKLVARDAPWYSPLKESLATPGSDVRGVALAHGLDEATFEQIVHRAALLNTTPIVEGARNDPRYKAAQNARPPKKIGKTLALFDCTNCDKCVPVCPNDANFTYALEVADHAAFTLTRASGAAEVTIVSAEPVRVTDAHQLANYADFCNECGNCDVFCPEDGGPYVLKPRFFGSETEMDRHPHLDGVVVQGLGRAAGRFRGVRYRLDDGVLAADGWRVRLVEGASPEVLESPAAGGTLSTGHGVVMALLCAAVLAPSAFNPVRAEIEAPAP